MKLLVLNPLLIEFVIRQQNFKWNIIYKIFIKTSFDNSKLSNYWKK